MSGRRVTIVSATGSPRESVPRSPWTREPDPAHVLDGQRVVEPVLVPDRREHLGVALLGGEGERGVARDRPHADEHEHAGEEDDDQGGSEPCAG